MKRIVWGTPYQSLQWEAQFPEEGQSINFPGLRKKYFDFETLNYRLTCSNQRKEMLLSTMGKLAHARGWSKITSLDQGTISASTEKY